MRTMRHVPDLAAGASAPVRSVGEDARRHEVPAWEALHLQARRFAAVVGDLDMDPDDLVQDAMEALVRQGDPDKLTSAYLYRTIHHRVLELRRTTATRRNRVRAVDLGFTASSFDDYPSDLAGTLDGLDPTDRALLHLAYLEGWTHRDLAAALDLSEAAVRKRLERARTRFRRTRRRQEAG